MTDDEINAAIAEACGFVGWEEFQPNKNGPKFRFWDYPKNWSGPSREPWVPRFCTDLNAMHEAETTIYNHNNLWATYYYHIGAGLSSLHATARKKAEAFLKTLGKWKEATK